MDRFETKRIQGLEWSLQLLMKKGVGVIHQSEDFRLEGLIIDDMLNNLHI